MNQLKKKIKNLESAIEDDRVILNKLYTSVLEAINQPRTIATLIIFSFSIGFIIAQKRAIKKLLLTLAELSSLAKKTYGHYKLLLATKTLI